MWSKRTSIAKFDVGHSPWPVRYAAAAAMVFVALLFNLLPPVQSLPFLFFFAAVALSARLCGFGPAVFATALSAFTADFFLLPPRFTLAHSPGDFLRLFFFALVSFIISSIARQKSRLEKDAEKDRAELAAIVESSEDAIYTKTLEGTITKWKQGAERLYGYTAKEIVGQNVTMLGEPGKQAEIMDMLRRLSRGERIEHFETERKRKDGSKIYVSLSISPLFDAEGKIIGASSIARDITAKKLSEEALRRTEKLAGAGRLAATVAHEINNPLESVTNLLYLLRKNNSLDDRGRRHLELADQELARVAHMTRQTLGFYRDSSYPIWIDLSLIMDEVLGLYMRKLEAKRISVQKEYMSTATVPVLPGEMRQVFSNLIANAIEAMTGPGEITVRIANSREWKNSGSPGVRVTVADSGSGINFADRKQIFEPFYTTKKDIGTGLGLWISKEIVEKHGGSLCFRSSIQPDRSGTVFSVFVPARSNHREI